MTIVGCRIDGRLIHGQVANLWTTKLNVSRIMVIDDEVAQNDIDPDFVNPKEKLYDKFPLTVHQMDIIIGVLFALIALFLVLGFTHTSFFGLFGG